MHNVIVETRDAKTRQAVDDDLWTGLANEVGEVIEVEPAGIYVKCDSCDWHGNNPYPDTSSAQEAAKHHTETAEIEEKRALAIEGALNAESVEELNSFNRQYLEAGVANG